MKVAIFDLETSNFYADAGIILCACIKEYGKRGVTTIRADEFPSWKKGKSDNSAVVKAILDELDKYDILVAHNGQRFDKGWLNAKAIKYGFFPIARLKKFIDPVLLARRYFKIGRNSLAAIIDFLNIRVKKTPIELEEWVKAAYDSNRESMDIIVEHCVHDVDTLHEVYDRMRPLIDKIDSRGSAF